MWSQPHNVRRDKHPHCPRCERAMVPAEFQPPSTLVNRAGGTRKPLPLWRCEECGRAGPRIN